jgi:hypothetical protein
MEPKNGAKTGPATAVADVRAVPLDRLSEHSDRSLRRVIPTDKTPKLPVAAFDAAL